MVYLRRIDPARNMARFYTLALQRSLFGETLLVRCWGRIGGVGRARSDPFPDDAAAGAALERLAQAKGRRGYQPATALT